MVEINNLILSLTIISIAVFATTARSNSEGDALYALRRGLSDPDNVLQSWDPNLVNPCTWFHITCNQDNRVTRVYATFPFFQFISSFLLLLLCQYINSLVGFIRVFFIGNS